MRLERNHYRQVVERLNLHYNKPPNEERGFFFCPFHGEKNPSLSISFDKGIWHCFSCHKGGSLNELCKQMVGKNIFRVLGLEDEFKNLGEDTKLEYIPYQEKEINEENISLDIRGVLLPYNLSNEALSYLHIRGISLDIAKKYNFQYAEDININGRKFMKRLMIPIYGEKGKLVNYEGRDVTRKNKIKVLYPKDSIKPIWNIQNLDRKAPLYVTEGLIDLFLLEEDREFFNNITVIFGSAISSYQKKMLQQFDKIIGVFNNDNAGRSALENLKEELGKKIDSLTFSSEFKDIGEIWEKKGMKVKEFREKGGFDLKRDNDFSL